MVNGIMDMLPRTNQACTKSLPNKRKIQDTKFLFSGLKEYRLEFEVDPFSFIAGRRASEMLGNLSPVEITTGSEDRTLTSDIPQVLLFVLARVNGREPVQ